MCAHKALKLQVLRQKIMLHCYSWQSCTDDGNIFLSLCQPTTSIPNVLAMCGIVLSPTTFDSYRWYIFVTVAGTTCGGAGKLSRCTTKCRAPWRNSRPLLWLRVRQHHLDMSEIDKILPWAILLFKRKKHIYTILYSAGNNRGQDNRKTTSAAGTLFNV